MVGRRYVQGSVEVEEDSRRDWQLNRDLQGWDWGARRKQNCVATWWPVMALIKLWGHVSETAGGEPVCRRAAEARKLIGPGWLCWGTQVFYKECGKLLKKYKRSEWQNQMGFLEGLFWKMIWRQEGCSGSCCSHIMERNDALNLSSSLMENRSQRSPESWRSSRARWPGQEENRGGQMTVDSLLSCWDLRALFAYEYVCVSGPLQWFVQIILNKCTHIFSLVGEGDAEFWDI